MLRLDLQFYAFFMTVISGAVLGLLFDVLRVTRGYYRLGRLPTALADLVFWVIATAALTGSLFMANWAELRLYVVVGVALGVVLYLWMASSVVGVLLRLGFRLVGTIVKAAVFVVYTVVWVPLRGLADLLWFIARTIIGWMLLFVLGVWNLFRRLALGVVQPAVRVWRCARLRYLLARRRRRSQKKH